LAASLLVPMDNVPMLDPSNGWSHLPRFAAVRVV